MKHATRNTKLITFMFILFFVSCFMFYDSALAQYQLETALPNLPNAPASSASSGLPGYINYLFIFGLSLIAFLALAQMMIGGIQYILAAGNVANKVNAKDTIKQALLGLGLLLVSYLLLYTINPDLVNLRNPNLTPTTFTPPTPPYTEPTVGQPCADEGGMTPGGLICQGGIWVIMVAPPYYP